MVPRFAAPLVLAASLVFGLAGTQALQAQDAAPGRVAGVASDSASGQPLQAVQLFLSRGTIRLEARTNAEGRAPPWRGVGGQFTRVNFAAETAGNCRA